MKVPILSSFFSTSDRALLSLEGPRLCHVCSVMGSWEQWLTLTGQKRVVGGKPALEPPCPPQSYVDSAAHAPSPERYPFIYIIQFYTNSVPSLLRTSCLSTTKTSRLKLFTEIIGINCEYHTIHTQTHTHYVGTI